MLHDIHMIWFHVFEGSLTSFSKINLTSYLFFNLVVFFTIKIFSNPIFENPYQHRYGRTDGRVCLVSFIEKSFILCITRVVVYELYTWFTSYILNWYLNWYSFLYILIFSIYVCSNFQLISISIGIIISHTYIWFACAWFTISLHI